MRRGGKGNVSREKSGKAVTIRQVVRRSAVCKVRQNERAGREAADDGQRSGKGNVSREKSGKAAAIRQTVRRGSHV